MEEAESQERRRDCSGLLIRESVVYLSDREDALVFYGRRDAIDSTQVRPGSETA
jgi:hypothetical protein